MPWEASTIHILLTTGEESVSFKIPLSLKSAGSFDISGALNSLGSSHGEEDKCITDKVIEYIHQNYNMELTNRKIADAFNFHPNYINRLMVINTGMSLHKYIINTRINKAMELIYNSDMTISEIAYSVGFKDIHYFSSLFKRKMGCSPSSIR